MDRYKLYVLDGLNHDRNTLHGRLFMDMLSLRIAGYYKYYGSKLMPIDLYDYFSRHFILSKETDGKYVPVSCLRSISASQCRDNEVEFLPIIRTKTSNKKVAEIITDLTCQERQDINYDSGLTISPLLTSQKEIYKLLKYIIGACLIYHNEVEIKPFLISSIEKTKTDRLFKKIGFKPLCKKSEYKLYGLESEKFKMLKYNYQELNYQKWAEASFTLWNKRTELINSSVISMGSKEKILFTKGALLRENRLLSKKNC